MDTFSPEDRSSWPASTVLPSIEHDKCYATTASPITATTSNFSQAGANVSDKTSSLRALTEPIKSHQASSIFNIRASAPIYETRRALTTSPCLSAPAIETHHEANTCRYRTSVPPLPTQVYSTAQTSTTSQPFHMRGATSESMEVQRKFQRMNLSHGSPPSRLSAVFEIRFQ